MLQGFSNALVHKAEYFSAQVSLELDGKPVVYKAEAESDIPDLALQHLEVPLVRHGMPIAQLQVRASFSLGEGSPALTVLLRMADELADAIFARTQGLTGVDLQAEQELLALAVRHSPFSIVITNPKGALEYCNDSYCRASGFTLNELIGTEVLWATGDPLGEQCRQEIFALKPGQHWQGEVQGRRKNGVTFWDRQVVSSLCFSDGQVAHWVAVRQDITESKFQLKRTEETLLLREQALVSSSNGIMITRSETDDHSIVYVNPAFERITGYSAQEVANRAGRILVRDDLAQPDLEEIRAALREKREGRALLRNYRKDGTMFWNDLTISPVKDASGTHTTHFVSVINDVSERVNYQKELEYQSSHDSLTGLANRNLLNDRIAHGIAWAKRNELLVAIMLLDLDHFKLINDASGHGAGDEMLKEVAKRLSGCVRETDTVARLGGDEFVLVLTDLQEIGDVDVIAEKILMVLSKPLTIGGHDVEVTASIGISFFPRDGDHGEILLRYADIAMYRVKEHGRNGVRQFMPEMGATAISRLNMESAMRRGLERGEFRLHYQPKIDLVTGRIVGAEALVRWEHPQIGLIHPIEFITLAEESGLILPLGEWVLAEACRQQVAWMREGIAGLQLAVNVSPRQFRQDNLAARVKDIFHETGVDAASITLELTESIVMHDVNTANAMLNELKNLGLRLSLDDFGTGYSSLAYLRKFPIGELKIDKSFVNDIHANLDDAAIIGAIIAMAKNLGLQVVAEGVETQEQVDLLGKLGCKYAQGYFFGRPLDVPSFVARYHQQPRPQP